MQYILNDKEYQEYCKLTPCSKQLEHEKNKVKLLKKKLLQSKKFICIHNRRNSDEEYCDDCPLLHLYVNNENICELYQNCSK